MRLFFIIIRHRRKKLIFAAVLFLIGINNALLAYLVLGRRRLGFVYERTVLKTVSVRDSLARNIYPSLYARFKQKLTIKESSASHRSNFDKDGVLTCGKLGFGNVHFACIRNKLCGGRKFNAYPHGAKCVGRESSDVYHGRDTEISVLAVNAHDLAADGHVVQERSFAGRAKCRSHPRIEVLCEQVIYLNIGGVHRQHSAFSAKKKSTVSPYSAGNVYCKIALVFAMGDIYFTVHFSAVKLFLQLFCVHGRTSFEPLSAQRFLHICPNRSARMPVSRAAAAAAPMITAELKAGEPIFAPKYIAAAANVNVNILVSSYDAAHFLIMSAQSMLTAAE